MKSNSIWGLLVISLILTSGVFAQPELDTSFNSTGKTLITIAGYSAAWNMAVQPDNKIIIVSGCTNAPFCSVRLNQDGSTDTTFGGMGQPENLGLPGSVLTRFGPSQAQRGQATAIALQSDGKIIVTGAVDTTPYNNAIAMVRYNGDGTLDTTFGTGGKVWANITGAQSSETVRAVAVQPDGKIVITGDSMRIIPPPNLDNIWSQFVARYLPNGTLDSSFGIGGIVKAQTGSTSASGQSLAIQPDGKILVGGNLWVNSFAGPPYRAYYVARLDANGNGDQNWNTPIVTYSPDYSVGPADGIRSIAVQPDGRVVALGYATRRLFQFTPNGLPDTSFDNDGARSVFLQDQDPYDLAVSPDGRITVVGMSRIGASWITDFPYIVERFTPDGIYDWAFGDGGRRYIYFSPATRDGARTVAFDQIGRTVIAGIASDAAYSYFYDHTVISAVRLTAPAIAPASSTITGRVLTAEGLPVSGVTMRMADNSGAARSARTNPFGYYQFAGVMSGQLYSISVKSRTVAISPRSIFVAGDVSNFDFTAAPLVTSKAEFRMAK